MQKVCETSRTKKIRSGDRVVVISGDSKGQHGIVKSYRDDKVVIEGINICKKAIRPNQQNPKGGFVEIEAPIHVSNVRPCDAEGRPLKVKISVNEQGERQLCAIAKNGQKTVLRSIKRSKA